VVDEKTIIKKGRAEEERLTGSLTPPYPQKHVTISLLILYKFYFGKFCFRYFLRRTLVK
jgi:hypothetical protein